MRCSYAVQVDPARSARQTVALSLTPELYTAPAVAGELRRQRRGPLHQSLQGARHVTGDSSGDSGRCAPQHRWVAAPDRRHVQPAGRVLGGALVQLRLQGWQLPVQDPRRSRPWPVERVPVAGGQNERLPAWDRFDAAFTAPDGDDLVLQRRRSVRRGRPGRSAVRTAQPAAGRFGRPRTPSPRPGSWTPSWRADSTPTCSPAPQYFRYQGSPSPSWTRAIRS